MGFHPDLKYDTMKLTELSLTTITEGGQVFKTPEGAPKTQRIHVKHLPKTLHMLAQITQLPIEDHVLGSVGKKASSGDIDIAVDETKISKDELVQRLSAWATQSGYDAKDHVKKSGISVHFLAPIGGDPDQGWCQVDFMFHKDPTWMKFAMHSAGDASEYSGADRNLLMSSIAKAQGLKYSWQKGLLNRSDESVVSTNPDQIAHALLGPRVDHSVFDSVEQMQEVIHKNKTLVQQLKDLIQDLQQPNNPDGSPRKPGEIRKNQEEADRIRRLTDIT